jgi:hypothetical protein
VARDAAARLYDVEKNTVGIDIPRGLITFRAKKGKSIDLERLRASLQATRLSGSTGMEVRYLEVTARGSVVRSGPELRLKVPGGQQFVLEETSGPPRPGGDRTPVERLREAMARGETIASVTGRVQGWKGLFPDVLRALAAAGKSGEPPRLTVTDFVLAPKKRG